MKMRIKNHLRQNRDLTPDEEAAQLAAQAPPPEPPPLRAFAPNIWEVLDQQRVNNIWGNLDLLGGGNDRNQQGGYYYMWDMGGHQ